MSRIRAPATAGAFVVGVALCVSVWYVGRMTEYTDRPANTSFHGTTKIPGHNVDRVNIEAMIREADEIGYSLPMFRMVVEYAGQRWARGEEQGAFDTMTSYGIDLTSQYRIVAAGQAHAYVPKHVDIPASVG